MALLEILVALVLFAIALVPIAGLFGSSSQQVQVAAEEVWVANLACELMEQAVLLARGALADPARSRGATPGATLVVEIAPDEEVALVPGLLHGGRPGAGSLPRAFLCSCAGPAGRLGRRIVRIGSAPRAGRLRACRIDVLVEYRVGGARPDGGASMTTYRLSRVVFDGLG